MTLTIVFISEKTHSEEQIILTSEALRQLLNGIRNEALREASNVCKKWRKESEASFNIEKLSGNFTGCGKLNVLNLSISDIEMKIGPGMKKEW